MEAWQTAAPPGAVIKPSIWLWGCLITQPDPQSETAMSLETRSDVGGRLKPRYRAEGECLNTLNSILNDSLIKIK